MMSSGSALARSVIHHEFPGGAAATVTVCARSSGHNVLSENGGSTVANALYDCWVFAGAPDGHLSGCLNVPSTVGPVVWMLTTLPAAT
jgi:hypothetical protein